MSTRRTVTELGSIVLALGAALAAIFWLASHASDLLIERVPVEVDRTLGEQLSKASGLTMQACPNGAALRYVEQIAAPLLEGLEDHRFQFKFRVADTPEVNAFALPGGFVTVNRGLLEFAQSGDEVAAVLGHELQHVLRRHGTRRLLRQLGSTTFLNAVFGGTDILVPASMLHDFVSSAYDRDEEREADALGLALLAKARIDPRAMARFFGRLAKTGVQVPALLSTHPDPGDRAAAAEKAAKTVRPPLRSVPSPKGVKCR